MNLMDETKDLNWHVIGLIEVKWPGEKLVETKKNYLFYHKRKEIFKQNRAVFLVQSWKNCEHGNNIDKHKCLNCEGNHTSTAKSCTE